MKFLISALILLTSSLAGFAQDNPAQEVRRLERSWLDAYEQRDEKAMNAIVADDFVITFPDGVQQTKAQIIAALKGPRPTGGPAAKFSTENVEARVYGDTVVLSGRVVTEYHRDGRVISKQQQRYTDTYVKLNGRWQVVASQLSNDGPSKPN